MSSALYSHLSRALARPAPAAGLALGVAGGSLAAAYFFQYAMGLAPCPLCLWQRLPHAIALGLGLILAALAGMGARRPAAAGSALAALVFLAGAGIAFYHVGVEQLWWQGTAACSPGGVPVGLDGPAEMRAWLEGQGGGPACDEIPWAFLGLSIAGWNLAISALTALVLAISAVVQWRAVARLGRRQPALNGSDSPPLNGSDSPPLN